MKDKIAAYGKEYIRNFKQNPLSATAVLIMQIIFILGWGVFFLYLLRLYFSFVIPGITDPKGNIYADTLYAIFLTFVYTYCIYRFSRILFKKDVSIKHQILILLYSIICALLLLPIFTFVHDLPFFNEQINHAFWAR